MIRELFKHSKKYRQFIYGILLPVIIAVIFFLVSMFIFIIPSIENALIQNKKEQVKGLTETAWGILYVSYYHEIGGILSREDAKKYAVNNLSKIRYGNKKKDYYWIIDTVPQMIMHPYREDLVGKNLSSYKDKYGHALFLDIVDLIRKKGEGLVDYYWQWQDDSLRIEKKVSYVKEFKPWGWIIGTGIYLDDVNTEIKKISTGIFEISVAIIIVIIVVLIFVLQQALKIEKKRQSAEKELLKARDQYQALAEANPEGTILVFDDNKINLNKNMQFILGYSQDEVARLTIYDLILQHQLNAYLGEKYFRYLILGVAKPKQFEAKVKRKDGVFVNMFLSCTRIQLPDKVAVIITAKDTAIEKVVHKQLGISREKYAEIIEIVNIGFCRILITDQNSQIIDANRALIDIMQFTKNSELLGKDFYAFFADHEELNIVKQYLLLSGNVQNLQVKLKRKNNEIASVVISALLVNDHVMNCRYVDIIVYDRSNEIKKLNERDKLLIELQASHYYLNTPLKNIFTKVVYCQMATTVGQLIEIMIKEKTDAILVKDNNIFVGIITDQDLRNKVLFKGLHVDTYANECMTSPLISLNESAKVYDALLLMQQKKINHIAIINSDFDVSGMLSINDIIQLQQNTSSNIIYFIQMSRNIDDWKDLNLKLQTHVNNLVESGANVSIVNHFITELCDVITIKLCEWAIERFGIPPVSFAFIALGSQGRNELSLKADQDNALIFNDTEENENVRNYFLDFSHFVCYGLDTAGFELCKGDLMAFNPKWCLSIKEWKNQFNQWINNPAHDDIFEQAAFFDLKMVYGDEKLVKELKNYISNTINTSSRLTEVLLKQLKMYKPPINIFGKFLTDKTDRHPEAINLKKPLQIIIDITRLLALVYGITETNTLERLEKLKVLLPLQTTIFEELEQAYNFLGILRLQNQLKAISKSFPADNYINPKDLSELDITTLRKAFLIISNTAQKLEL